MKTIRQLKRNWIEKVHNIRKYSITIEQVLYSNCINISILMRLKPKEKIYEAIMKFSINLAKLDVPSYCHQLLCTDLRSFLFPKYTLAILP